MHTPHPGKKTLGCQTLPSPLNKLSVIGYLWGCIKTNPSSSSRKWTIITSSEDADASRVSLYATAVGPDLGDAPHRKDGAGPAPAKLPLLPSACSRQPPLAEAGIFLLGFWGWLRSVSVHGDSYKQWPSITRNHPVQHPSISFQCVIAHFSGSELRTGILSWT